MFPNDNQLFVPFEFQASKLFSLLKVEQFWGLRAGLDVSLL